MIVTNPLNIFSGELFADLIRGIILIFLIFYTIFALIIVRQVDLMSKTLITSVSPIVKAIAIVHAGLSIGFLILVTGLLR